ncbi:NADPH:quinone reductase [Pedobacter westerhofensis]|uniref:NADPH:quinone reductase n=1 Tax=Pedobacter westerhofensis TaxID=425512 RepID=A0A521FM65_9SPHI|nr:zinc-binding dehydrogenase [Pedobacter westerhofensis]SMO97283.1 NADPH:quinone reductase [Pedobacter westerhofensis]
MKAAVYYENGGPEVFRLEEVPAPVPQIDEILIRIHSISIEGGDLISREMLPLEAIPTIVGYQSAGTIVAMGDSVTGFSIGQRVLANSRSGSHAEYIAVEASRVWAISDQMSFEIAAAVPVIFFTAHECLFTFGRLQAGQTVLIHGGSGALGLAAIQIAKKAGARIITTGSDDDKLERLRAFGADYQVNYRKDDFVEEVMKITNGRGVDLVLDSVGGSNLARSIQSVRFRGIVTFVGGTGRDQTPLDPYLLWPKNVSLSGVFIPMTIEFERQRLHDVVSAYLQDIAESKYQVVLDKTFSLNEVTEAHQYILDKKAFGRVIMQP